MRTQFGLVMNQTERERLARHAIDNDYPSLSAAIRAALPNVFCEEVREGRPPTKRKDEQSTSGLGS